MTIIGDNYGELDTDSGEFRFYWQCRRCGATLSDNDLLRYGQLCRNCAKRERSKEVRP